MTYKNHLEKIQFFTTKTIEIYLKYAHELEYYDRDYEKMLLHHYGSINTKRLLISAIKNYYKYLGDERWKKLALPKKEIKFCDFVSYDYYKLLLSKINRKTKMGFQKRIIVRLLFETGIRASELLNIKKTDIELNRITIKGKGRRERVVFLSNWLFEELSEYLQTVENILFSFGYKNLYKKIQNIDKQKKISPHMFRRGYAKHCHDMGISIYDISLSMGHSSIETTASYIKRKSEDVKIHKIF